MLLPYTKEHKASLWGRESRTTPTLVDTVFGDGGSLITLDPTNSRPDYYLMLAPSSIKSFEDAIEFISYNEELIFEPIELEFGNVDDDSYDSDHPDDPDDEPGSLALNIGSGYTAGYYDNFKRRKTMKATIIILLGILLLVGGCLESFNEGFFRGYGAPTTFYRPYHGISNDMLYQQQMEGWRSYNVMMRDMNNRFMDSINSQPIYRPRIGY